MSVSRSAWLVGIGLAVSTGIAAPPTPEVTPVQESHKWAFSLLPKAFQRNPRVDLAVITEMTEAGRKLGTPTPERPIYYFAESAGFHAEGHGAHDQTPVEVSKLQAQLQAALVNNGYVASSPGHPPTVFLVYFWGVHNRLDEGFDDVGDRNLLSRARLVGGEKFATDLLKALNEQATVAPIGGSLTDPIHRLMERDKLTRQLMEQTFDDCYYVVVSCYQGAALARGERRLLWRTKMSTAAQGVGLRETLPALVAGGAPFFGRDMNSPAVVAKELHRGVHVEIGETQVKEYIDPATERKR